MSQKPTTNQSLRLLRYLYLKILRQEGTPEAIARGWACGIFAGCFPLFGVQTIIGILLAALMQGNKITAAAGTWVSNPFTYVPIYYFNFRVGELILQRHEDFSVDQLESWAEMGAVGGTFISTLLMGCMVVGLTLGICVYFLSLGLTNRWRSLKQERQKAKKQNSNSPPV